MIFLSSSDRVTGVDQREEPSKVVPMNETTNTNHGQRLTDLRTGNRAQPIPARKVRRQGTKRGAIDAALREYGR